MSKIEKLYVRYYCPEKDCGYKFTITKGLPRSKNGVFHPATYGCSVCNAPLCIEVNDGPFPVEVDEVVAKAKVDAVKEIV